MTLYYCVCLDKQTRKHLAIIIKFTWVLCDAARGP